MTDPTLPAPPGLSPADLAALRQAEADWRAVLKTAEGRRAVAWLLRERCGLFEDLYVPGGEAGRRHTDYNAGRRFVGLELCAVGGVRLDAPFREIELEAQREHQSEQPNRARRLAKERQRRRQDAAEE